MKTFLSYVALLACVLCARADYRSTVLGDSAAAYWRLDDSNITTVCTNYGSAGSALNAYYNLGKFVPRAGAIAGDSDPCAAFDGVMDRVEVPYTPTLNPANAFSVEFWALRTIASSASGTYYAPIWSRGNGTANGFLFYVDPNNKWTFWMGATNSATTKWVNPTATNTMVANTWYHLVGTYRQAVNASVTNWYATLYVNGVLHSTIPVDTNGFAFQPNCVAATGAPYISPFRIGAGNYAMPASAPWPGYVDEVTFYTNALTDLQVSNHWAAGTNAARAVSYFSTITNDVPIAYWRLNETNTAIAYNQSGASLGATANGIYAASPVIPPSVDPATGILINPSNYPGTLQPLVSGALTGSGDNNAAINLMPWTAGNATGAKVEIPYTASLNTKTFSVECWANLQSLGTASSWNSLISSRTVVTGANGGYDVLINSSGQLQFWVGGGGSTSVKLIAGTLFPLNTWNHVVAVYDGAYMYLYLNGELVGATQLYPPYLPNLGNPMRIGAGSTETVQGSFCVMGKVDEVAYYSFPLSTAQVGNHYATGLGTTPTPVTVPTFTVLPQTATVETGGAASLTGIATGSVPMSYQWYKDGSLMANQTNCTLNLSNLAATANYEVWVTNGAGINSISAAIYVNPPAAPSMITDLPATTPFYPGASPQLSVAVGGSLPMTYYWTSNSVTVAVTNVPRLTLSNLQAAADGVRYSVTISNASGALPSAGTTLQALTPVSGDYVVRAIAGNPISYWRLGESSSSLVAADCLGGNNGQYVSVTQHVVPGALAANDDGCAQLTGSGSHIEISAGSVFDSLATTNQFTLMAWVKPSGVSGTQRIFSTRQSAPYAGGFGFGLNGANLIFSAFGVADVSFTAGLLANQWYHLAAVYSNKTVTCYLNGNIVGTANAALNSLLPSSAPLYLGGNPTSSEWFTGLIDEAAVYGSALNPSQVINIFGTKPGITLAPVAVTAMAGSAARFSILGSGQTPLRYQWRTNGVAMAGQTNTALTLSRVPLAWNGLQAACVITNALGAITSAPVALTVVAGSGYVGSVLADGPVAYWRLDESTGPTIRDFVATHDGTAMGSGITYRSPSYGTPLDAGGDTDACVGFNGSGLFTVPYAPELNQIVYSVECWACASGLAANFAAPIASRYGTTPSGFNLYAGLDGNFLGYTWQMWSGTGIQSYPWDYAVGPVINNATWAHLVGSYNGSNVVFYVNGEPVTTNTVPFVTNTVSPFSIGAIANGTAPTPSANFYGNVDEVAYYGYVLSPYQVMSHCLLASFGTNQPPRVDWDLAPQTGFLGQPCTVGAGVVGSVAMTYQWYKDNVPVVGGGGASSSATNWFNLTFPAVQYTNAGIYKLLVTNAVGWVSTSEAVLSVVSRPVIASAGFLAGGAGFQMKFSGPAGMTYRLWSSPDVSLSPVETTWTQVTAGTFTGGTDEFIDPTAQSSVPVQFYILMVP